MCLSWGQTDVPVSSLKFTQVIQNAASRANERSSKSIVPSRVCSCSCIAFGPHILPIWFCLCCFTDAMNWWLLSAVPVELHPLCVHHPSACVMLLILSHTVVHACLSTTSTLMSLVNEYPPYVVSCVLPIIIYNTHAVKQQLCGCVVVSVFFRVHPCKSQLTLE